MKNAGRPSTALRLVGVTLASLYGMWASQPLWAQAPPRANMQLKRADTAVTNTSDTQWTLTKTGFIRFPFDCDDKA